MDGPKFLVYKLTNRNGCLTLKVTACMDKNMKNMEKNTPLQFITFTIKATQNISKLQTWNTE